MAILKVEPSAINTEAEFSFANISVTGNISVGTSVISATEIGDIVFSTPTGPVEFNSNTVNFLSNIAIEGPQGAIGYTGSAGANGSIGYTGSQGVIGYTGSAGTTGGATIYSASVPSGSWTGSGPYTQIVSIVGLTSATNVILDLDLSAVSFGNVSSVQTSYALVYRAVTGTDQITLYATSVPANSFNIFVAVI